MQLLLLIIGRSPKKRMKKSQGRLSDEELKRRICRCLGMEKVMTKVSRGGHSQDWV